MATGRMAEAKLAGDPEPAAGERMLTLAAELFPICRSITGNGVRESLRLIGRDLPLEVHEVPSGTPAFDWIVPPEWNISRAWIRRVRDGAVVADFADCSLHVMGYSVPVSGVFTLSELKQHIHTLPDHPDWIPYRTSYYARTWGFCLSHKQLLGLEDGKYEVLIDSRLEDGSLTYAECVLPGDSPREILISTHVCHPYMANDNLSGLVVAAELARRVWRWRKRRYTYRFLFTPATIGAIVWLSRNEANLDRLHAGLILSCLGDSGGFTYKRSRQGAAEIDRVVEHVLHTSGARYRAVDFSPYGYDERQYCSPGFNLPVGCLMRTPNGEYPEYHSSADSLDLLRAGSLEGAVETLETVCRAFEGNRTYRNLAPKCEPQLGRRGIYRQVGGPDVPRLELAQLWVLNYSDGEHSLLDIAERSGLSFELIQAAAQRLAEHGLLARGERT